MEKVTYALYAKAIRGEEVGEWVMCWNFYDEATARWLAEKRKDVGAIVLFRHHYNNKELVSKDKIETFSH